MRPLKSLTFVRIGNANSHKYKVNKKQLRAFKTVAYKINKSWQEFDIKYNVIDWNNGIYDKHWSNTYYKGRIADPYLIKDKREQESLIQQWLNIDNEQENSLYKLFKKLNQYCSFNKDSYHSPPQERGLYAFPQYRVEPFLIYWDDSKFVIKQHKDGESKVRAKKFI
jgi:hypothetical protein